MNKTWFFYYKHPSILTVLSAKIAMAETINGHSMKLGMLFIYCGMPGGSTITCCSVQ